MFSQFIISGTLVSMLHVISGPDHLAAITPLVIEEKKNPWAVGVLWGLGHLVGMLLVGFLFLLFKESIPIGTISSYSEQLVAIVLIAIGIWAFYKIFHEQKKHRYPHTHSGKETYVHVHELEHNRKEQHQHKKVIKQSKASALGIGFLHGLAGVSHFLLLLPVLGFQNVLEGTQYVAGFAIGTILAMSAYALVLGKIASYSKHQHNEMFFKGIRFAGGLFAIVVGLYWLYLSLEITSL